jgi:photosystem II stability/assembly factor-like uncharacterized protein
MQTKIIGLWRIIVVCTLVVLIAGYTVPAESSANGSANRLPSAPSLTTASVSTTTTTPGSVTYEPEPPTPDVVFVNDLDGWASGGGGILATSDGGHTWKTVFASPEGVGPMSFLDHSVGWAVDGGTVIETQDGGATWRAVSQPAVLAGATQLTFVDPTHGWAVGSEMRCTVDGGCREVGSLMATSNRGHTWIQIGVRDGVSAMCWASAERGWSGDGTTLRTTKNGGATWSVVTTPLTSNGEIYEIACSGETAWVGAGYGVGLGSQGYEVIRTLHDGERWQRMFGGINSGSRRLPRVDAYLGPIVAPTPDAAILVGSCPNCDVVGRDTTLSQGTISVTTADVGKAFQHYSVTPPQGPGGEPVAASFPNPDHGWILASVQNAVGPKADNTPGDVILASRNGGRLGLNSFAPLSLPPLMARPV